jgi:ubiquitin fusion degradation protein 1
MFKMLKFP